MIVEKQHKATGLMIVFFPWYQYNGLIRKNQRGYSTGYAALGKIVEKLGL